MMATTSSKIVAGRPMRVRELRALVQAQDYCVDPMLVAVALLRRTQLSRDRARSPSGPARRPHGR